MEVRPSLKVKWDWIHLWKGLAELSPVFQFAERYIPRSLRVGCFKEFHDTRPSIHSPPISLCPAFTR
jgi:hypothetical protein